VKSGETVLRMHFLGPSTARPSNGKPELRRPRNRYARARWGAALDPAPFVCEGERKWPAPLVQRCPAIFAIGYVFFFSAQLSKPAAAVTTYARVNNKGCCELCSGNAAGTGGQAF